MSALRELFNEQAYAHEDEKWFNPLKISYKYSVHKEQTIVHTQNEEEPQEKSPKRDYLTTRYSSHMHLKASERSIT